MSKKNHEDLNSRKPSKESNSNWDDNLKEPSKFKGITDKQRALMIKLGIKYDNRTTREHASGLISKCLESRKK